MSTDNKGRASAKVAALILLTRTKRITKSYIRSRIKTFIVRLALMGALPYAAGREILRRLGLKSV